jgi:hypothetical protein
MTTRRALTFALLATVSAATLAGCNGVGARLTFNDTEKVKVTEIMMAGGSGDVTVRTAAINETRITRVVHGDSDPTRSYRLDGTVLAIDTDCGDDCQASYTIEAPTGVAVRGGLSSGNIGLEGVSTAEVRLQSGDILIRNATGPVQARSTSGDIHVLDAKAGAVIEATSGDVRATDISGGPVTARVTSGDVTVRLTEAQSVTASASSGDVTVIVPGGDYQLMTETRSGEERVVGIANDPAAEHVINVQTSSGDATITGEPAAQRTR